MAVTDTKTRSLAKALSWRFLASILTFGTAWLITGDISAGLKIGMIDVVLKLAAYYLHERAWQNLEYGRLAKGINLQGDAVPDSA